MNWIYLLIAGFFEIFWAVGLKMSQGFSKILPSALKIICLGMIIFGIIGLKILN